MPVAEVFVTELPLKEGDHVFLCAYFFLSNGVLGNRCLVLHRDCQMYKSILTATLAASYTALYTANIALRWSAA